MFAGGPDSSPIGAAKPQDMFSVVRNPSRACGTPIAELSGPPELILPLSLFRFQEQPMLLPQL